MRDLVVQASHHSQRLSYLLGILIVWIVVPSVHGSDEAVKVATWHFDSEESLKLASVGGVQRDQPGPRPPEFPDFDANNLSAKFDGKGSRYVVTDPGKESEFDFDNGDQITLEAWVNVNDALVNDRNFYIIGKGRTGDKNFSADNQNWALRLRIVDGTARVNFLFATQREPGVASVPWHRWTSDEGFRSGSGWHRIAVQYEFGKPESIRGWLDDKIVVGKWDMGGATSLAPIVDDDAVWIGSALGGDLSNSFKGQIDEVTLFRSLVSEAQMAKRYRRVGPDRSSMMQKLVDIPPDFKAMPGTVAVRLYEGLPAHDNWSPPESYKQSLIYQFATSHMLFARLPKRYDDWGIRASWKPTVLLQAVTEIELPVGKHQLLLRGRGMTRVWFNDSIVAKLSNRKGASDGHNPVQPYPEPPAENHRSVRFGDQEVVVDLDVTQPGLQRVALETLVGSSKSRAEPGETLVAIRRAGEAWFELVQPSRDATAAVSVSDHQVEPLLSKMESHLLELDAEHRRKAAQSQDDYWQARRKFAGQWLANNPIADAPEGSARNPIDRFIEAKIVAAKTEVGTGSDTEIEFFHKQIKPILTDNCLRCHGVKAEGGLSLLSRDTTVAGGDSGSSAVVPGKPQDSELIHRVASSDEGVRMPPSGSLSSDKIELLKQWVSAGAAWGRVLDRKAIELPPKIDDAAFIRRAYLDTVGIPPTELEARDFINCSDSSKRERLIDRLLADKRMADHWVSYWQDVLAENPNILKPSLNNTGPFRYFIYDAIVDHKPLDRMVSELIMLRGSEREGGSAGFGMAADNDSPLATRSIVMASAFLGVNLQCARCHDSPYHSTTQGDLFATASMLARKPLAVPKTSTVAPGFFEKSKQRQSLIKVTLKTGVPVEPKWCFEEETGVSDNAEFDSLLSDPSDSRQRLAALVTVPTNQRFAAVMVNRIWKRLIGTGLVEPADDWENQQASHDQLLTWLSRQLIQSGYDMRHIARLIMNSQLYQRQAGEANLSASAEDRFFAAPDRRRLTAEQIVDSMFAASGQTMQTEEITFDNDGRRPADVMISLGHPKRAWEFAALSNERDRPSLSLPRAQAITDVMEAFGWTGARQNVVSQRELQPNVLQPGVVAGGVMASWICRAADRSPLAELAITSNSPEQLVDSLFLRFLSRLPNDEEKQQFVDVVRIGFENRLIPKDQIVKSDKLSPLGYVGWTNHLRGEANEIMIEHERRARVGEPGDPRLDSQWREAFEDVVWSVINSPEFAWVP